MGQPRETSVSASASKSNVTILLVRFVRRTVSGTTPRRSSSLLPCSMALMQASETAVFRSFDAVGGEAHDFGDTGGGAHGDLFEAEPGGEAKFSDDRNVDHDSTSVAARWR